METTAAGAILDYWFSSIDDTTPLDKSIEPFRTCFTRWYGKQPAVDTEVRERFEGVLRAVTADGTDWTQTVETWRREPKGLLALVLLLDQMPRNMYRDQPAMYAHDPLALVAATTAIAEYEDAPLSLVERMFLYVPLMHVENLTVQQAMVARFERLAAVARTRSPQNAGFYDFALGYARKHAEVVARYGRFPHRNPILGRASTADELVYLERDDAGF